MQWWRWSFLLWHLFIASIARKTDQSGSPLKVNFAGNLASFVGEDFSGGSSFGFEDNFDNFNAFYPFIPGVDQEVSLFGFPSFSVTRAHPVSRQCPHRPSNQHGPCDVIFENHLPPTGRQFNRRTGTFICNILGLYYFSFSALSPAFTSFRLSLTKNDHEVVAAYGAAIGNQMASNNALLMLRPGDKVCLKLSEGQLYESDNRFRAYTSFSGFLIKSIENGIGDGHGFQAGSGPRPFTPSNGLIPSFSNSFHGAAIKPDHSLEVGPRKLASIDGIEALNATDSNSTEIS
ncbi:hypothetical protein CHUAL_002835 [Chamberlinius hualienensis]